MQTKLTLRMDNTLIKAAKKYSKAHGKSLSQLVADHFILVTQASMQAVNHEEMPPITSALRGILRGKKLDEADYKKYLEDKFR